MSLADLLNELTPEQPKTPTQVVSEALPPLPATQNAAGTKLGTADIDALGARLKTVRKMRSDLEDEEDRLRKLILVHPLAKIGYANDSIEVSGVDELDTESAALLAAVLKADKLNEVLDSKISATKVRKLAEKIPEIKAALTFNKARRINTIK